MNTPESSGNTAQIGWDFTHAGVGSAFGAVKITLTAVDGYGITITSASSTTGTMLTVSNSVVTTGKGISVAITSNAMTSGNGLSVTIVGSSLTLAGFTGAVGVLSYSLTNLKLSGTCAHTGDLLTLTGTIVQNGAGGTTTATGNGISLSLVHTATAGTFSSDARIGVNIAIGLGVTGAPISITQSNITSTHFYKILTEVSTGVTLWFSDNTTANGALTGAAGDICFNAGSHKPEYCSVAGTTWVALV